MSFNLISGLLISAFIVIVFHYWQNHNRYHVVKGSDGIVYQVDKNTGESWVLTGIQKIPQTDPSKNKSKELRMPISEMSLVTGSAGLSYGSFSGKLYNGSNWTISKITLSLTAIDSDGTVRWSRYFSKEISMKKLTAQSFSVTINDNVGLKEISWKIEEVFGYK